jgi:serine protease Do
VFEHTCWKRLQEQGARLNEQIATLQKENVKLNDFEHSQCVKLLIENAQLKSVITDIDPDFLTRKCRVCGCTWDHACEGGALVNMYGQIVGITSSKIEATGYEGMGFAIPINTAQPIINSIIKYGYVTGRVKIGISVQPYAGSTAYGYPAGLQIMNIDSSSDAAAKGLAENDIITKINGIAVTSYDQFYQEESKYKAGDSVKLTIFRYSTKSTFEVSVKLAEDKGDTVPTTQKQSQNNGGTSPFGN